MPAGSSTIQVVVVDANILINLIHVYSEESDEMNSNACALGRNWPPGRLGSVTTLLLRQISKSTNSK